jgi:beta-lactam-binding protein with PASTA domain
VPNVFGLGLTAAKAAIRKARCTVGIVRKVYSNIYYPSIVYSQSPPRGTVLASRAPVNLTVSLGHRP